MSFECATRERDPWKSGLYPDGSDVPTQPTDSDYNDGVIEIPRSNVTLDGTFNGKHKKETTESPVVGKCKETPKHKISLFRTVEEEGSEFIIHYRGEIVDNGDGRFVIKKGRYKIFKGDEVPRTRGKKKDRILGEEDGTWIGERPIT
jgi:hypothetical protein